MSRGPKYSSGMALKVFFKQKWSVFLLQQSQHFFQVVVNCQRMPIALQPFQLSHYKKGCTYSGRLVVARIPLPFMALFSKPKKQETFGVYKTKAICLSLPLSNLHSTCKRKTERIRRGECGMLRLTYQSVIG